MNALSVNSVNSLYVRTTVAQQRVAADRANVIESETQLRQDQTQLDKDLTYLAVLQRKTHDVQQIEGSQAQSNAENRIEQVAQSAKNAAQQASASLAFTTSASSALGASIDVEA
jgi:predicted PurR-regulated permease PerM